MDGPNLHRRPAFHTQHRTKGTTMTDIYTDEGTLDYAEAARTLASIKAVGNDTLKTQATNRITAAALLDIAVSLNGILTAVATGGVWLDEDDSDERETGPDGEPMGDEERETDEPVDERPIEVGDWVVPRSAAADELAGFVPAVVIAAGVSEGTDWVEVDGVGRIWVTEVVRVDDPAKTEDEAEEPSIDEPTGADLVDDIDSDFDAPTNETVKPPKVKGSGKGKTKSKGDD